MRSTVQMGLFENNILPMRNYNHALRWRRAARFPSDLNASKGRMIMQLLYGLGHCKISLFVTVSKINYLSQPSASAMTNHYILLNVVQ